MAAIYIYVFPWKLGDPGLLGLKNNARVFKELLYEFDYESKLSN